MASERDYASERERRKNQSEFQFQGGTQGLERNAPRSPSNKPRIPVDKNHYVPGRATQEARQLAAAHSRPQNANREQLPPQYEQDGTQQVAFVQAIPVVVIGGVVLVAVGATLLLQVQDENGETVTLNEYASRPVADLMETISNDVRNYYQTEAKDKIAEIRSGVSQALNKIVVREEPEPQIYTTPDGEQGTIEHTGHAPPEVETGIPPFDTESGRDVNQQRHTGHGQREQQTAEDFVLESRRRDVRGHDDEGGHTDERHVGKPDQWLRNRQRDDGIKDSSSFTNNATANLTQARFVKAYKKEIKEWLSNKKSKRPFSRDITMDREIGTVVAGKGKARPSNKAKVVLRKDNSELGYHILTSFPIP